MDPLLGRMGHDLGFSREGPTVFTMTLCSVYIEKYLPWVLGLSSGALHRHMCLFTDRRGKHVTSFSRTVAQGWGYAPGALELDA